MHDGGTTGKPSRQLDNSNSDAKGLSIPSEMMARAPTFEALESMVGNRLAKVLTEPLSDDAYSPTDNISLFIHPDAKQKAAELIDILKSQQFTFPPEVQMVIDTNDVDRMCQYVYRSKLSKSFAELAIFEGGLIKDNGSTWSPTVFDILEGVYPIVECNSYHSGAFGTPVHGAIFDRPKPIKLAFTPGICFNGQAGQNSSAFKAIVTDSGFSTDAYVQLMKRRLEVVFKHIDDAHTGESSILLKVPGISCGYFGGPYATQSHGYVIQKGLSEAIRGILEENEFRHIKAVVFDVYKSGTLFEAAESSALNGKKEEDVNGVHFLQYESEEYNRDKSKESKIQINSNAEVYDDKFQGYTEVALVAADALSLPGNDMYRNSYETNEGVWAGTAEVIQQVTGCGSNVGGNSVIYPDFDDARDINVFDAPNILNPGMVSADMAMSVGR